MIFVKGWSKPIAWAKKPEIGTLPSRPSFLSYMFSTFESRQECHFVFERVSLYGLLYSLAAQFIDGSDCISWLEEERQRQPHLSTAGTDRMNYLLTVKFPGFECDHQSFMHISKLSCFHVNVRWSDFYYKTQPSPGSFLKADQKHKDLVMCCL